ncbi:histidine phosphatase family protein [Nonomuraea sp. M3C6]|uniref:Histidine phosphatase family protein n=1 Tax=Nonomuraea marmarensis TaxID=3351344 RepID=A0ABW7AA51_9ACTN
MLFVRHASTPGMRAARFPADEPADASSLAKVAAVAGSKAWVAPSRAALQTAVAMGLEPVTTPALAEADCGRWRGLAYEQVAREEPDALASWLSDPHAAPHGGESLAALAARVAGWLEEVRSQAGRLDETRSQPPGVVVCDAGAIRAALGHVLGLGPVAAARFDLAPLSTTELTVTRGGWRVAHVNRKVLF